MTRLLDLYAPQYDVSESLVVSVRASPAAVLDAIDDLIAREPFAGMRMLARELGEMVFCVTWNPAPRAVGRVDTIWNLRLVPDEADGCHLISTRRFCGEDDAARLWLLAHWSHVRQTGDVITRRSLQAIRRSAERRPARIALGV